MLHGVKEWDLQSYFRWPKREGWFVDWTLRKVGLGLWFEGVSFFLTFVCKV